MMDIEKIRAMHADFKAFRDGTDTNCWDVDCYERGHRDFEHWMVDGFSEMLDAFRSAEERMKCLKKEMDCTYVALRGSLDAVAELASENARLEGQLVGVKEAMLILIGSRWPEKAERSLHRDEKDEFMRAAGYEE